MSIISLTGNLTEDAVTKTTESGTPYILLRLVENIYKKEQGKYVKDEQDHYITLATHYHSVFVFEGGLCFQAQHLKKGNPLYVKALPNFKVIKDEDGFDINVLASMKAVYLDTNPFEKKDGIRSAEELETV